MKKNTLAYIVSGVAMAMAASAHSYQWELGARYTEGDIDTVIDADTENLAAQATYYLSDVDTGRGPLAEAAFLDRASSVSIGLSDGETDSDDIDVDADTDGYFLSAHAVSDTGWYANLGYSEAETDIADIELETEILGGGFGYYIAENATLALNYAQIEYSSDDLDEDLEIDTFSLDYKLVVPGDVSYAIDASIVRSEPDIDDADHEIGHVLGVTIYPTNNIGFGATYASDVLDYGITNLEAAVEAADEVDIDAVTVHASWFINESFSIGAAYTDGEIEDVDFDAISVGANIRF